MSGAVELQLFVEEESAYGVCVLVWGELVILYSLCSVTVSQKVFESSGYNALIKLKVVIFFNFSIRRDCFLNSKKFSKYPLYLLTRTFVTVAD